MQFYKVFAYLLKITYLQSHFKFWNWKLKMYSTKMGICTLHSARWSPVQGMQCWKKWMKCISSLYGCFIFLEGVYFSFLLLHMNFLYLICWCFLRVKQHSGITCAICVKGKYIFTMSEILKLEQWYLLNVEIILMNLNYK